MKRPFVLRWFLQYRLCRGLHVHRGRWYALRIGLRYARWGM